MFRKETRRGERRTLAAVGPRCRKGVRLIGDRKVAPGAARPRCRGRSLARTAVSSFESTAHQLPVSSRLMARGQRQMWERTWNASGERVCSGFRSSCSSRRIVRSEGGLVTPRGTEKHRPWVWPRSGRGPDRECIFPCVGHADHGTGARVVMRGREEGSQAGGPLRAAIADRLGERIELEDVVAHDGSGVAWVHTRLPRMPDRTCWG